MQAQHTHYCDPETGLCTPASLDSETIEIDYRDDVEVIYVGDPMCSWCWGISPQLNQLKETARENQISYQIVLGGLRPGGGDEWNEDFKNFLKHHWEEVNKRSGQPFGFKLFERDTFNYDTEPACRAVVAARKLQPSIETRFFELVQHHFYVQNNDPKELDFYKPICRELGLDFKAFSEIYEDQSTIKATMAEFQLNRQWGVSGYPTVLFRKGEKLYAIARGYASFDQMWNMVEQLIND